ncbi:hypothetical protein ANANG_G00131260, partial [Anguilla anguilla]
LSQSSCTLTLWGFLCTVRTVGGEPGGPGFVLLTEPPYTPHCSCWSPVQSPFPADGIFSHTHRPGTLTPTSTSQQCLPELNPSEPSTHTSLSNLSGLSGTCCLSSLSLTLVRSSDSERLGCAVFGSRVTGAEGT